MHMDKLYSIHSVHHDSINYSSRNMHLIDFQVTDYMLSST
jgi:hypothetical protein